MDANWTVRRVLSGFLVLIFGGLPVAATWSAAGKWRAQTWPSTPGRLLSTRQTHSTTRSGERLVTHATYAWTVEGQTYRDECTTASSGGGATVDVNRIVVYYNPARPSEHYLVRDFSKAAMLAVMAWGAVLGVLPWMVGPLLEWRMAGRALLSAIGGLVALLAGWCLPGS